MKSVDPQSHCKLIDEDMAERPTYSCLNFAQVWQYSFAHFRHLKAIFRAPILPSIPVISTAIGCPTPLPPTLTPPDCKASAIPQR